MQLVELGRTLKIDRSTLNAYAREGVFTTAKKVKDGHLTKWEVSDQEADQFISSRKNEN